MQIGLSILWVLSGFCSIELNQAERSCGTQSKQEIGRFVGHFESAHDCKSIVVASFCDASTIMIIISG